MSSNVHNRVKFGKISRKELLGMKMKKKRYRKFDHSGTLSISYKLYLTEGRTIPEMFVIFHKVTFFTFFCLVTFLLLFSFEV